MSKDATIREIHHRVKNNLQTIAALLRLQGRRLDSPEAQAGDRGVGAADPLDRDRARDAVTRRGRRRSRSARSCRPLVRVGRGDRLDATSSAALRGRGRRRRAAGRGGDAARGRAQRAHAERGRPRVPRDDGDGPVEGHVLGPAGPRRTASSSSRCIDDGVGLPDGLLARRVEGPRAVDRAGARDRRAAVDRSRCTTTRDGHRGAGCGVPLAPADAGRAREARASG